MKSILIKNVKIIRNDILLDKFNVFCIDGKIDIIFKDKVINGFPADIILDAKGKILAPGYIDLHMHGTRNLLTDRNSNELEKLTGILPRYGVTSFLAGVLPRKCEDEDYVLLEELAKAKSQGAQLLGFFLEGHFLSLTGVIYNLKSNRTIEYVEKLKELAEPYRLVFGISPEYPDIGELLPYMTTQGYPAFITHTMASVEQTEKAITMGAIHATHFYDVFPYPGEKDQGVRACGAVEAILAAPSVSVDFILDGEHVDPTAVKMALQCKDSDSVCFITDANINAGMPPGRYTGLGGSDIVVEYEGGPARLAENAKTPGGLAGSRLTMDRAVRNAVSMLDIPITQAIKMASYNPAKVLGLQHRKGKIVEGYDADMVLLDRDLAVQKCWVGGKEVSSKV
jgi:N-acetylglucosamine-6-phosphate deacetylase